VRVVEPLRQRAEQRHADHFVVESHPATGAPPSLALEQPCARAPVAHRVEAAIGHGSVEVGEVHVGGPGRDQICEQRMHDIDGVLAASQHALGLAHQRRSEPAIRRLWIRCSFHLYAHAYWHGPGDRSGSTGQLRSEAHARPSRHCRRAGPLHTPYKIIGAVGAGATATFQLQFTRAGTPAFGYTARVLEGTPR